tara:strand:+ start:204 stop:485 length:282 start_codon:yes stop_codon:yes gene_type:complete
MAKSNRATRKELETVIGEMIEELRYLRQSMAVIDNYVGAYIKFKGDTLMFSDFLRTEIEKAKDKQPREIGTSNDEDIKGAKKSRYKKVATPPL